MLIKGRHTDSVYCLAELVSRSCLEKEVPSFSFVQRCHWVGRKWLVDKDISSTLGPEQSLGCVEGLDGSLLTMNSLMHLSVSCTNIFYV